MSLLGILLCAPLPRSLCAQDAQEVVGEKVPGGSWLAAVSDKIEREEYRFSSLDETLYSAPNRSQELRSRVHLGGIEVFPRECRATDTDPAWKLKLRTASFGRVGSVAALEGRAISATGERVEIDHGSLTEWFVNDRTGIEQGWTLDERPAGTRPLVIGLELEGELSFRVEEDGRAGVFVNSEGEARARYAGLVAWDATGRELDTWMTPVPGGLRVHVEDRAAVYPVTVDPLITNEAWSAVSGQASAYFGQAVSEAGDVNGDGYGDVIVGAPGFDDGGVNSGRAYVYYGSPTGLDVADVWVGMPLSVSSQYGCSVSGAGDVNGDGYDDVVIGLCSYGNGETLEGAAHVFHGSVTGLGSSPAWGVESNQVQARYGYSVSGAGDVNGDGYADVIVGAIDYSNGSSKEGRAFVYHGSATGLDTSEAWSRESNQAFASFGSSVSGAGDVNGDGYADVVVGALNFSGGSAFEGRAYVYHGSANGLGAPAWTGEANRPSARYGASVSGAGDVNGDGFDDVIVGARDFTRGQEEEGRAYVYHGSASGLATGAAWTMEPDQAKAFFGESVSGAGDVNGDGYADVIVGAVGLLDPPASTGRAFVYHGSADGLYASEAWSAGAANGSSYYGHAVSSAGDVNGDGFSDVLVGAFQYKLTLFQEGAAFAYHGSSAGVTAVTPAAVSWRNAGTNPDSYVASPAALGRTWFASVDLTSTGHSHAQVFVYAAGGAPPILPGGQSVLVSGGKLAKLSLQPGPAANWAVPLPNDPAFCGITVYSQALHLNGVTPFALSNAQDLFIGY